MTRVSSSESLGGRPVTAVVRPQTVQSNTMATNSREVQGRKGDRLVALCIGVGAGIGMALGAAIGAADANAGTGIGLGAGIGIALGIAWAGASRASGGGRAEPFAPPNGGPVTQPANSDTPKGRHP